jgi:hypothetical protein
MESKKIIFFDLQTSPMMHSICNSTVALKASFHVVNFTIWEGGQLYGIILSLLQTFSIAINKTTLEVLQLLPKKEKP